MAIQVTGLFRGRTRSFVVDTRVLPPLDIASDETFFRWLALEDWDARTLAEYAAAGGARIAPSMPG